MSGNRRLSMFVLAGALVASAGCDSGAPTSPPPVVTATLATLTINRVQVEGGASAQGTAKLSAAAPAGGTVVTLSSNTAAATVPATVTVAAGATSASFTITTTTVSAQTTAIITGSAGGVSRTANLAIAPPPAPPAPGLLASLDVLHDDVIGGQTTRATITLVEPAPPAGLRILLSSNDQAVQVPTSVTIAAGATSQTFEIRTTSVTSERVATITATVEGAAIRSAAATLTLQLRVLPPPPPPGPAPNAAPTADSDSYSTNEDNTLSQSAPGVLDGDSDPNGDTLTAQLVNGPNNGTLTLNSNGSFTYTPNPNFNGMDSFSYRASDGSLTSNAATVTLTVNAVVDEETFEYTGGVQEFTVPAGVTTITVDVSGAAGENRGADARPSGSGGRAQAVIVVTPGEKLQVVVGGRNGFNGGGAGGAGVTGGHRGASGGGASDIRRVPYGLGDRLIVAGGGGGGGGIGDCCFGNGGRGGGINGEPGQSSGAPEGRGGGQFDGGAGGGTGQAGTFGSGGAGASGIPDSPFPSPSGGGGGGGGGYYGGGGGGAGPSNNGAGGGGGSGFGPAGVTFTGSNSGNGRVIIRY